MSGGRAELGQVVLSGCENGSSFGRHCLLGCDLPYIGVDGVNGSCTPVADSHRAEFTGQVQTACPPMFSVFLRTT